MLNQVKKSFGLNGNHETETSSSLARIYCLLSSILTPAYVLINFDKITVVDIVCLSVIEMMFIAAYIFSSRYFQTNKIKQNLFDVLVGIYLVASAYAIYAAYKNNFSVDYSFGLTILFFVFSIVLREVRHIILYFSVTAALGSIALFFTEAPEISMSFLVSFFLIFFCLGFFSVRYKAEIQLRLQQRENLLKTLFNQAYDAILLVDYYSRVVVDCNDAAVKLFGVLDKSEIIGQKRDQFEQRKLTEQDILQCRKELTQSGMWKNETQFTTRKGRGFWGEVIITPLTIGGSHFYVARINDITSEKIAKAALSENEERYRTIFKRNPQPIWIYDRNTLEFIDVNDEAVRFYGYSHEEFLNMTILNVRSEQEKERMEEYLKNTNQDDQYNRYTGDWIHKRKDGSEVKVEIIRTKINLPDREANLALIKDVTDIRKAEKALLESEECFRRLSEITTEAITIHDQGKIIEVNAAFTSLFGYAENEAIGMLAMDMAAPVSRELIKNNILSQFEQPYEAVGQKKDGSTFSAELIGKKINYKNKDARVTIIRDITNQRKAEKVLRESQERLNNFMNSASDVFVLYDENLVLLEINAAGMKMTKTKNKSDLIGKHVTEIFQGIEKTGRLEKYMEVLQTGKSIHIDDFMADYAEKGTYLVVVAFKVGNGLGIIARDITERKKTEEQLIESERNYRLLVEQSPDGILIMKLNKILYANNTALQIFGIKKQEEIPDIFEVILPEYHQLSKDRWEMAMSGREVPFAELKIKRKDGTKVEVESKPSKIIYQGKPAMQVALHDLTQLKQLTKERIRAEIAEETARQLQNEIEEKRKIEKQLLESQKYTKRLIDSSLDMICASDTEGKITEINDAALRTFGYKKEEILGQHVTLLYASDTDHHIMNKNLSEGPGTFSGEIVNKRKNGERFISYLSASVLKDDHGIPYGFMGVSKDITEFKNAENALKESHRFVDSVIENIPNMVFVKEAKDLRFVRFNKAGEDLLGVSKEEILGKTDYDFFPEEQAAFFTAKDRATLAGKKLQDIPEEPINTLNKGKRILHTKKIPILDDRGNPQYLLGISEDITEMKEAEEMIMKSLQEKEILLKEVHHRVKNNMQVISSILNLQTAYTKDKKTLAILKESQNRIKTMALIHESLYQSNDFSKINFSEYILNLSDNLVYSYKMTNMLAALDTDIEANIILNIDRAIPCGLIINELISNAFKHAFKEPSTKNKVQLVLKKSNKIFIEINDNGVGFEENIDYRNTETLGLQLVTTLVDQLGGEISVQREGGTRFRLTFNEKQSR